MLVHIIDDDETIRRTLSRMVRKAGWEAQPHVSADAFLAALESLPSGCIVCDINMPGKNGIELIALLRQRRPEWPVVMISGAAQLDSAISAFRHGAVHFLQKPFRKAELIAALAEAGEVGIRRRAEQARQAQSRAVATLTARESEVLGAFARGLQSKTIGFELGISTRTVEMHRSNILAKLDARNTPHAVCLFQMAGAG